MFAPMRLSADQSGGPHGDTLWPADGIYRVCPELNSVTLARMQAGLLAVHHLDYLVDALLLGELLTGRPHAVRPKVVDVDARLLAGPTLVRSVQLRIAALSVSAWFKVHPAQVKATLWR